MFILRAAVCDKSDFLALWGVGLEGLPDSLLSPVTVQSYHSFATTMSLERVAKQSPRTCSRAQRGLVECCSWPSESDTLIEKKL